MNKQIVFVPEIVVNSKTDKRIVLSPDMQLLILLMGDFVCLMNTGKEKEGIELLPYIGRLISHAGLPPVLQDVVCTHRPISLN